MRAAVQASEAAHGVTRRTSGRLPWVLLTIAVVIFGGAAALSVAAHEPSTVLPFLPALLVFSVVGAVVASRRPDNPLGWLMLAMSGMSVGLLADAYARYGLSTNPHAVGTSWAAWAFMVSVEAGTVPLAFILLLFPHGKLPSPRWRVVAWAAAAVPLVGALATATSDVNFSAPANFPMLRDPVRLLSRRAVAPVYGAYQFIILFVILAAAASLVVRFRRSRGEERQQLTWIAYAGALAAAGFVVLAMIPNGPEPVLAFITLVPLIAVAAGIAILKYRLYDIDVVINKTVVYGALAGFIALVYVAVVVGLGTAVGSTGGPNLGLSIAATAIVAFAFQPVRERSQRVANRLVYGERATPYEVLSDFSGRIGGAIEDDRVLPAMARVVAEGTGAATVMVWLRRERSLVPAASWPDGEAGAMPPPVPMPADGRAPEIPGADLTAPIRHQGDLLGALTVVKRPGEALTPGEAKLLEDLSSQAGLVLRNVALTADLQVRLTQVERQAAELRASRQRIVAAADAERRRLERDIHDGAQQHLVALAVRIRLVRTLAARDPERAARMLEDLRGQVADGLATLRQLAGGIYPDALVEHGLVAALEGVASRAPVPVALRAEGVGRRPPEVEAAVYFCVLEALQNVAKYAQAERVVLRLTGSEGDLVFEVEDDGRGFAVPEAVGGTGLQGMADRLAAVGGSLDVLSAPGSGTNVIGRIPLRAMERVG